MPETTKGITNPYKAVPITGESLRSAVIRLFFWSGPLAVARLVVPIIVDALYRVTPYGLATHVGKKILVFIPSLTNANSTTAVVLVGWVRRSEAPSTHLDPRDVFSSLAVPRFEMSSGTVSKGGGEFSVQATTTESIARSQCVTWNYSKRPAGATAKPERGTPTVTAMTLYNRKPRERESGEIVKRSTHKRPA